MMVIRVNFLMMKLQRCVKMFDVIKNLDKRISPNELKNGDLVFVHNPFITKDISTSNQHYGPGIVVRVIPPKHNLGPKDAVDIEILLSNETKITTFWGTLWHFYRM